MHHIHVHVLRVPHHALDAELLKHRGIEGADVRLEILPRLDAVVFQDVLALVRPLGEGESLRPVVQPRDVGLGLREPLTATGEVVERVVQDLERCVVLCRRSLLPWSQSRPAACSRRASSGGARGCQRGWGWGCRACLPRLRRATDCAQVHHGQSCRLRRCPNGRDNDGPGLRDRATCRHSG